MGHYFMGISVCRLEQRADFHVQNVWQENTHNGQIFKMGELASHSHLKQSEARRKLTLKN